MAPPSGAHPTTRYRAQWPFGHLGDWFGRSKAPAGRLLVRFLFLKKHLDLRVAERPFQALAAGGDLLGLEFPCNFGAPVGTRDFAGKSAI